MRSDRRKDRRRDIQGRSSEGGSIKNALYITGTILALGVIAFFITVMVYNNSLEKVYTDLEGQKLAERTDEEVAGNETEETSTNLGRTIEEMENVVQSTSVENEEETTANVEVKKDETKKDTKNEVKEDKTNETTGEVQEQNKEEEVKQEEPKFAYPVDGEIMKEYAKDNLVYSETLKEWVTHFGVDIKADKTTVVKASEKGKVTAIKNDPRYGTTVIIEHANGFETRYANLLTAEFVNVGEDVTKGQTIGTVGNTGAFEVLDDFHLHFEILKDEEYQDPMLYIE